MLIIKKQLLMKNHFHSWLYLYNSITRLPPWQFLRVMVVCIDIGPGSPLIVGHCDTPVIDGILCQHNSLRDTMIIITAHTQPKLKQKLADFPLYDFTCVALGTNTPRFI